MFTPARFVVVDDNPKHLDAILDVFQKLGTPCQGVAYDAEREFDSRYLQGVRVLFLDIHLTDSALTTDEKKHFAIIASILENGISPTGGPFILVIWTENDHLVDQLKHYLDDNGLDATKPYAHPLAIVSLAKRDFIDLSTGVPKDGGAEQLRTSVQNAVSSQPQLSALVEWESDVQSAARATLSTLVDLVPNDGRNSNSFPCGLDETLSRLAQAAVGKDNVATDSRAAVAAALAPILADRIVNQAVSNDSKEAWKQAVTWQGSGGLDADRAGKVNRMLHVAIPPSEPIRSTDWGAVVEFPAAWWDDNREMKRRFGVKCKQLLGGEYKIEQSDRDRCHPRLVRVGAACDHAQNRPGPILYLFGLEIPVDVQRKKDNTGAVRLPAAEWSSPTLMLSPDTSPFILAVNTRYWVSVTPNDDMGSPVYRLREQLLMHLISHASGHMARPGIVQL